jgi:hypothetical protein
MKILVVLTSQDKLGNTAADCAGFTEVRTAAARYAKSDEPNFQTDLTRPV